jgi:hypothetical protein
MHRVDAWRMIQRRAADLGTRVKIGCHTFRATGITAYLEAGGTLENAQLMAAHESPRTTKLYDRTGDEITLDEVEYSATIRMAGQRQQACPVAAREEDGVTDAARQVSCCTARHVDDAVMTSLCLMSRLLSLGARRFCRAAAER